MTMFDVTLPAAGELNGEAVVLEAEAGSHRARVLQAWLAGAAQQGRTALRLDCDVDECGVWAGLEALLNAALPHIRADAPWLLEKHSYELCLVLPRLRGELTVSNPCLTDVASDDEKVRNYPNDRAYRNLHGLIDLLDEWYALTGHGGWAIACDHFDRATPLVQRFFAELLRRRGERLGLALLLAVDPGNRPHAMRLFDARLVRTAHAKRHSAFAFRTRAEGARAERGTRNAPNAQPITRNSLNDMDPAAAREQATQLEQTVGNDRIEWSIHIPRIIRLWERSDAPDRALPWLVRAVNLYDHDGLYEIAQRYAPAIERNFDRMYALDRRVHALAVINLFFCYAALGRAEDAYRILESQGLPRVTDSAFLTEIHYFLAMLHARFLPRRNQACAEFHLEQALAFVEQQDISAARRHFLRVFVRNGLAYVRLKQGRDAEALELCRSGLDELDEHLAPTEHRLHRSVLLYNAAQVLSMVDRGPEAIDYLSQAMQLDPNYSEYYLERGSLYLKQEEFAAAERDFRRAIELSPPYPEVWANLGQCYRAAGRCAEAVHAYSMALDLEPGLVLALVGRADARSDLGEFGAALGDYSRALELDPDQPLVLAGRAAASYELGDVHASLADLDRAIALAPEIAELHENREVALTALRAH